MKNNEEKGMEEIIFSLYFFPRRHSHVLTQKIQVNILTDQASQYLF